MAIPAYLWLKDDGGADIKGAVDVQYREGSIEVLGFGHGLHLPTDNMTGKITGTRMHSALVFEKEFDSSSPYLYKAVAKGQTLKSAEFKWYKINDAGQEVEYFNMFLENVKVVSICPGLAPIFPDTFYRFTHYWFAAADIPVANDIPVHCADAIRCNVRRPPQGSLPLLTRQVLA